MPSSRKLMQDFLTVNLNAGGGAAGPFGSSLEAYRSAILNNPWCPAGVYGEAVLQYRDGATVLNISEVYNIDYKWLTYGIDPGVPWASTTGIMAGYDSEQQQVFGLVEPRNDGSVARGSQRDNGISTSDGSVISRERPRLIDWDNIFWTGQDEVTWWSKIQTRGSGASGFVWNYAGEVTVTTTGCGVRHNNVSIIAGINNGADVGTSFGGLTINTVYQLFLSYTRTSPGSATGIVRARLYNEAGTTLVNSWTSATVNIPQGGIPHALFISAGEGHFRVYDVDLCANPTLCDDVADGTDVTGGGTRSRNITGIRTGIYDPLNLTRLVYSQASARRDPVVADVRSNWLGSKRNQARFPAFPFNARFGYAITAAGQKPLQYTAGIAVAGSHTIVLHWRLTGAGNVTKRTIFQWGDQVELSVQGNSLTLDVQDSTTANVQAVITTANVGLPSGGWEDGTDRWTVINITGTNIYLAALDFEAITALPNGILTGNNGPITLLNDSTDTGYAHGAVAVVGRNGAAADALTVLRWHTSGQRDMTYWLNGLDVLFMPHSEGPAEPVARLVDAGEGQLVDHATEVAWTPADFTGTYTGSGRVAELGHAGSEWVVVVGEDNARGATDGAYAGPNTVNGWCVQVPDTSGFTAASVQAITQWASDINVAYRWGIETEMAASAERKVLKCAVSGATIQDHIDTHHAEVLAFEQMYGTDLTGSYWVYAGSESDATVSLAPEFEAKLDKWVQEVKRLRPRGIALLGIPTTAGVGAGTVNAAMQAMAATDPRIIYLDNSGESTTDGTQWTGASITSIGQRLVTAVQANVDFPALKSRARFRRRWDYEPSVKAAPVYIATGDSITGGTNAPLSFTTVLRDILQAEGIATKHFANKWVASGLTSAELVNNEMGQLLRYTREFGPEVIMTLTVGGNDINGLVQGGAPVQDVIDQLVETRRNIATFVHAFKAQHPRGQIWVTDIYDASDATGTHPLLGDVSAYVPVILDHRNQTEALAAKIGCGFLSLYDLFMGRGGTADPNDWFATDWIHPNLTGQNQIAYKFREIMLPLVPEFVSGSKELVNAVTLAPYSRAGGDQEQYDNDRLGDYLRVERLNSAGSRYLPGDTLTLAYYVWDQAGGTGWGGAVTGRPATGRETGFTGFSGSDVVPNLPVALAGLPMTFLVDVTTTTTEVGAQSIFGPHAGADAIGTGLMVSYFDNGGIPSIVFSLRNAGAEVDSSSVTVTQGGRYWCAFSYDGAAANVRVYDTSGALVGSAALTGVVDADASSYRIGNALGAVAASPAMQVHRVLVFDAGLTTLAMEDVVTGVDETGGATVLHDTLGLRSGVYKPSDPTQLVTVTGAGPDLIAGID